MTAAGQRLLDLLLEDVGAASKLTISELSERAGTSESSVVRMSKSLGFRGYPDLRLALAAAAVPLEPGPRTVVGDITPDDGVDDVLHKLEHQESTALAQTASGLDRAALLATIEAVASARVVDVYGVAASALVGADLAQKLQRIGRVCQTYADRHLATTSAALRGAGDVAIAISHSGDTADVLEPLRLARAGGATTVAITSRPKSAVTRAVDHVLISAGAEERAFRPGATASRISQLLVVDAIFVGVAQRSFEDTTTALRVTREAVAGIDAHHRRR